RSALEIANKLPTRPQIRPGAPRPVTPIGVHYKDEAYNKIFRAAIHVHAAEIAEETVAMWKKTEEDVGSSVVNAWLAEDRIDEAIVAAHQIEDRDSRVSNLLSLARHILNDAGAPVF